MHDWWNYEPKLLKYHYFEKKEQFQLPVDADKHWRAFAVEEGEFSYNVSGQQGIANAGQLVICPPDIPFSRHTKRPITFHYFVFIWVKHEDIQFSKSNDPLPVVLTYRNQYRVFSSFSLLSNSHPFVSNALEQRRRSHLFFDLMLLYYTEQLELRFAKDFELSDPLMARARAYIERKYAEPISIQDIAEQIELSSVQLSRRFRKTFNINPSDFLRNLRLDKAIQLLTHTNLSLGEIALRCGYSSGFYFSRIFSDRMNMSPSNYREVYKV